MRHRHDDKTKQATVNRLSRAIGHLESVKRMVIDDEECSKVLVQLSAVQAALKNTSKYILKNHIDQCIVEAVKENDDETIDELKRAIDKMI
ncbi:MAG: metal-sensing transcriptional repressor [Clostridiales bacterium]|nr:metal-sensing transcriptional repressor [Clostridiales bacterium]MDD7347476.1 metal-sensing transcriptional repressor [Clostridiales bacterium]MDY4061222.1 metal-sensing transcriptional repressor [Anaerovoracaceae bacterium]